MFNRPTTQSPTQAIGRTVTNVMLFAGIFFTLRAVGSIPAVLTGVIPTSKGDLFAPLSGMGCTVFLFVGPLMILAAVLNILKGK